MRRKDSVKLLQKDAALVFRTNNTIEIAMPPTVEGQPDPPTSVCACVAAVLFDGSEESDRMFKALLERVEKAEEKE